VGGHPVSFPPDRDYCCTRVEIAPGQDDALILAIIVVIDMMAHQGR
jgi:uncharacterized protein YxjI